MGSLYRWSFQAWGNLVAYGVFAGALCLSIYEAVRNLRISDGVFFSFPFSPSLCMTLPVVFNTL